MKRATNTMIFVGAFGALAYFAHVNGYLDFLRSDPSDVADKAARKAAKKAARKAARNAVTETGDGTDQTNEDQEPDYDAPEGGDVECADATDIARAIKEGRIAADSYEARNYTRVCIRV